MKLKGNILAHLKQQYKTDQLGDKISRPTQTTSGQEQTNGKLTFMDFSLNTT